MLNILPIQYGYLQILTLVLQFTYVKVYTMLLINKHGKCDGLMKNKLANPPSDTTP